MLKGLPRLSSNYEAIFVLSSPYSTGMHAIVRVGKSLIRYLALSLFSRDLLQGSGFYCSFAEATGADYYWVITRQDDEG